MSLCTPEGQRGISIEREGLFSTADDARKKGDFLYQEFRNPRQAQNLLEQSINEYMRAAEQDDNPHLLAKIARAYALNGELEKAERYCNKTLAKSPLAPEVLKEVYEVQADLSFKNGDYAQSLELLNAALKLEKPWRRAKLYSGKACVSMAIKNQKSGFWAQVSTLALFATGMTLYALSQPMAFIQPSILLCLYMVFNRFGTPEMALDRYMKLYQACPGLEHLPIEIGKLYFNQGNYTEAEFWFSSAVRRYPCNDEGYHYLTELYQATANAEALVETLEQWLTIRPKSGEIMANMSQILAGQSDTFEQAVKLAQSSLLYLKSPVHQANAYLHLGNLYSYSQSVDAAIMAYQASILLNPEALDTYISLGTLYYDKQEYQQSQEVFEKALALSPKNAKILCNLGYLCWMQGNISDALDYYHQSIALDPTYDIALNNLGVLYLDHVGNIEKAMDLFNQTLQYNPTYALCYYNKGRAYSFLGYTIEAARCFQQAQELNETSQELDSRELSERIQSLFEHQYQKSEELFNTDM